MRVRSQTTPGPFLYRVVNSQIFLVRNFKDTGCSVICFYLLYVWPPILNNALHDKPYPLHCVSNFFLLIRDYSREHEYSGCDKD